jgi:hypothetical protein
VKLQVHTLRFGNHAWLRACAPTLDRWCERHGHELVVWDDTPRGYPCVKFCELEMMQHFLASDSDRMLYVDSDVWVHPEAPDFPVLPGIALATDDHHRAHNMHFAGWCAGAYEREFPLWEYSNAGVWSIDRNAVGKLLTVWTPPYRKFFQEQHYFNAAVCRAQADHGMVVSRLPIEWNRWSEDKQPAWFQHFWGEIDKNPNSDELVKLKPNY